MTARLLLLLPTTTYRSEAFVSAALHLGVALTVASERASAFTRSEPDKLLRLPFDDVTAAVDAARAFARKHPVHAAFGVDDRTAVIAAAINEALGLPTSPPDAVRAAGDKYLQRVRLRDAGVPVPAFERIRFDDAVKHRPPPADFPLVVKPLRFAASRGVMRVDDPLCLAAAVRHLRQIVEAPDAVAESGAPPAHFLLEEFIDGPEFALEGLVVDGTLHLLALCDKPDPMNGPTFPETLYVTPSRYPRSIQLELTMCVQAAVRALGLTRGPIHAELRHDARGVWLIELAARPIGGRCGEVLRFGADGALSLEALHLAHALGLRRDVPARESAAAGVMMLPVPRRGTFRAIRHVAAAVAVPYVTDVAVTAHPGQRVVPLPDESVYLGFVFGRAPSAAEVEAALRQATSELTVEIE